MRMIFAAILGAALLAGPVAAADGSPLHDEKSINDQLLLVAVVDKINRGCDSIKVKFFNARSFVNNLKAEAQEKGSSKAEVNSYIENKEHRAAMRKRRDAFFQARGASSTDGPSLCVFGHAEIQKQSQIGVLLRAK